MNSEPCYMKIYYYYEKIQWKIKKLKIVST